MNHPDEPPEREKTRLVPVMLLAFILILFLPLSSGGQEPTVSDPEIAGAQLTLASVRIDGVELFKVRGISSFTAEQRATAVSRRIRQAAADRTLSPDSVKVIPDADYLSIYAGKYFIINIYPADSEVHKVSAEALAFMVKKFTSDGIILYRQNRTREHIIRKSLTAAGSIVVLCLLMLLIRWLFRRIDNWIHKRMKISLDTLEDKSYSLIRANQLWNIYHTLIKILRVILIILFVAYSINYLLRLFPWTSTAAGYIFKILTDPILAIGKGILNILPDLAFLVVIFLVTRYVLKLGKLFFQGVQKEEIRIKDFDPEWAMPTFRIVKLLIIAFSVILAYPYIPGSDSNAFKGVSVFVGLLFSLGSSSFIANIIAGYTIIYRKAFKPGDRIRVDNHEGFVQELKVQVTRMRTIKNEEIVLPNSVLLNSNIINYSRRERELGLIIHATVGIGYETPWRQVEAMLKEAASRTRGLLKNPEPFVLQLSLGDFAVVYEINIYCADGTKLEQYYTDLYRNILDVFNENNVQIMTPAYMGDPQTPKVVTDDQWDPPLTRKKSEG